MYAASQPAIICISIVWLGKLFSWSTNSIIKNKDYNAIYHAPVPYLKLYISAIYFNNVKYFKTISLFLYKFNKLSIAILL